MIAAGCNMTSIALQDAASQNLNSTALCWVALPAKQPLRLCKSHTESRQSRLPCLSPPSCQVKDIRGLPPMIWSLEASRTPIAPGGNRRRLSRSTASV